MINKTMTRTIGNLLIEADCCKIAPDAVSDIVYARMLAADYNEAEATVISDAAETIASLIESPDDDFDAEYNAEPVELQKLLVATRKHMNNDLEIDDVSYFSICIGGEVIRLLCGGPQIEAIYRFVQHIADENGYDVDFNNDTVTGSW